MEALLEKNEENVAEAQEILLVTDKAIEECKKNNEEMRLKLWIIIQIIEEINKEIKELEHKLHEVE